MLYNRVASLVIGQSGGQGRELKNLRFTFSIQKGSTKTPNKATVKVWNASPETRAMMEVIGNVLILKAGYSEDIGEITIFSGDVTRCLTVKDGADWVTDLELKDGFMEFRDKKVSLSFDKGVKAAQVLSDIAKRFELPVRNFPAEIDNKQYKDGFAFVGRVREAMTKACDYLGLEWSIQNREVQVIKKGGVLKKTAIVISEESGMIGSPSLESRTMTEKAAATEGITASQPGVRKTTKRDKDGNVQQMLQVGGYKVNSLLQPTLEPGGYVQLKAVGIDGEFFRIEQLTHTGDTHGQEWQTELTLRYPKEGTK